MSKDIETFCQMCPTCAQYGKQATTEPMLSHPIPTLPWQFVSQDIFEFQHKQYFVTVDHFSDFYELDPLFNTQLPPLLKSPKPTLHVTAYLCVVSQTMALSSSQTNTRNLPRRMGSSTSPRHPIGLPATAKLRQLYMTPNLLLRNPTSDTMLCTVVSLNKREHVGDCIDYFILPPEHEFLRELESTMT